MKVTDTSRMFDLEALGRVASGIRAQGLHVSTIIRSIEETLGRYEKDDSAEGQRRGRTYQLGGFLWEIVFGQAYADLLSRVYGELIIHKEVERDGVTGSPDLLDADEETVIDTKMTWRSSSRLDNLEKNFWSWLVQMKAYCAMLGWRKARLVIFFANGDYRESGPQIKQIDLEFGEQEVEETWAMLMNHAKQKKLRETIHGDQKANGRRDQKSAGGKGRHSRRDRKRQG